MHNNRDALARAGKKLTEFQKKLQDPVIKDLQRCTCTSAIPIQIGEKTFVPDGANQCTTYDNDGNGINDSTGYPLTGCSCTY